MSKKTAPVQCKFLGTKKTRSQREKVIPGKTLRERERGGMNEVIPELESMFYL